MKTEYCGELQKGDFIIVSQGNHADLGFYLGRGQADSVQFYGLQGLTTWFNYKQEHPEYVKSKPRKWYINSPHNDRISKYSRELLNEEWMDIYDKALEALKTLNI